MTLSAGLYHAATRLPVTTLAFPTSAADSVMIPNTNAIGPYFLRVTSDIRSSISDDKVEIRMLMAGGAYIALNPRSFFFSRGSAGNNEGYWDYPVAISSSMLFDAKSFRTQKLLDDTGTVTITILDGMNALQPLVISIPSLRLGFVWPENKLDLIDSVDIGTKTWIPWLTDRFTVLNPESNFTVKNYLYSYVTAIYPDSLFLSRVDDSLFMKANGIEYSLPRLKDNTVHPIVGTYNYDTSGQSFSTILKNCEEVEFYFKCDGITIESSKKIVSVALYNPPMQSSVTSADGKTFTHTITVLNNDHPNNLNPGNAYLFSRMIYLVDKTTKTATLFKNLSGDNLVDYETGAINRSVCSAAFTFTVPDSYTNYDLKIVYWPRLMTSQQDQVYYRGGQSVTIGGSWSMIDDAYTLRSSTESKILYGHSYFQNDYVFQDSPYGGQSLKSQVTFVPDAEPVPETLTLNNVSKYNFKVNDQLILSGTGFKEDGKTTRVKIGVAELPIEGTYDAHSVTVSVPDNFYFGQIYVEVDNIKSNTKNVTQNFNWTDPEITAGNNMRPVHIMELRSNLEGKLVAADKQLPKWTNNSSKIIKDEAVSITDIKELRAELKKYFKDFEFTDNDLDGLQTKRINTLDGKLYMLVSLKPKSKHTTELRSLIDSLNLYIMGGS